VSREEVYVGYIGKAEGSGWGSSCIHFNPRQRQNVPPKYRKLATGVHCTVSQKTTM
jgi:hypothetical protein